jgi:hypothetical protein
MIGTPISRGGRIPATVVPVYAIGDSELQGTGGADGFLVAVGAGPGGLGYMQGYLRAQGFPVRMIGPYIDGAPNVPDMRLLRELPGNGRHGAHPGDTLVTMATRSAAQIAALPVSPAFVVILGGVNDLSGGASAATAAASLGALIDLVRAQPKTRTSSILVGNVPLLASSFGFDAIRNTYNALIPGVCSARAGVTFVNTCGVFTADHQVKVAGARDSHMNIRGDALCGLAYSNAILAAMPAGTWVPSQAFPRTFARRGAQGAVQLVGNLDAVQFSDAKLALAAGNWPPWWCSFDFMPTSLDGAALRGVASRGGTLSNGWALTANNAGGTADLQLYTTTSGGPACVSGGALAVNTWIRIFVGGGADQIAFLAINGCPGQPNKVSGGALDGTPLLTNTWPHTGQALQLGAHTAQNSQLGHYANLCFGSGASAPQTWDALCVAAEQDYFEETITGDVFTGLAAGGGQVMHALFAEGTGTALQDNLLLVANGAMGAVANNNGGAFTIGAGTTAWSTPAAPPWGC